MSEGTIRQISEIRQRIRVLARRMTLGRLLAGSALFVGFLCAGVLVAVGVEAVFWMATPLRTTVFWLLAVSTAVTAAILIGPPLACLVGLRPGPDDEAVARAVGERFPEIADRLLDMLQLASGHRSASPEPLVDRAVAQLGSAVVAINYREVERFDDFRRVGRLARWPVVGLMAFALFSPGTFGSAARRVLAPGTDFFRPAPFEITVEPGDVRLVKGDSLQILARLEGTSIPDQATLSMRRQGETRAEKTILRAESGESFTYVIDNVRDGFLYFVEAGNVSSRTYRVDVSSRPFVRSLQITLTPPNYTGMAVRRLAPDVGDVQAIAGTKIDVGLTLAGVGITQGEVRFDVSESTPLIIDDQLGSAVFKVLRDDRYRIVLTSDSGIENENPIDYRIKMIRDQPPAIFVLSPALSSEFEEGLNVGVSARIADDFGFSGLSLHYRLAESRFGTPQDAFAEIRLPAPAQRKLDQQIDFEWSLAETGLDLVPGDVVTFYLEVRDNDAVSGFKAATSGIHTIRFPSLTDQFDAVDEQQDDVERALEDLLNESEDIKDSFHDLRDELRRKQEGDWDDERMVEQLKERQKQLDEKVSDLTEKMESLVDEMADNNLLSPETQQKFEELKRVVKEISSPELQEALQRLMEAMKDLDLSEMQRSLGDFEFNEDQFKERIERALELFKRLRTEQQLEEAARRAEELGNREEEIAEQTERLLNEERDPSGATDRKQEPPEGEPELQGDQSQADESGQESTSDSDSESLPDAEQLAAEQERAAEDMEQLRELMEQISEQMQELPPAPTEKMSDALEQLEKQQMQSEMRQNAEDMRQGEFSKANQSQRQMQMSLDQLSKQLSQMQEEMSGKQLEANLTALRRALDDVLTLSLEEEDLRDDVRALATRDAGLRSITQQQAELLDGLKVVGDTLARLSRSIPQMSRQIQTHAGSASLDMEQAVVEMTERRGQQAIGHQKGAMTNLNELALLLSDLMQDMQSQQAGMGGMSMQQMMQQLQQMSGEQGQLNQQIQQFLNDMQGTRLSQDMQGRLQQMAAQQEAIRKQLEELGNDSPDSAGKLLGDLEQIARQMQETISEMQARQIDRNTYQRQQEILTRLLNAQRSLQERGKDNKRESTTADEFERVSPSELTPNERAERLRRELLRALEAGYSPDYEELIRRYFEALQQEGDGQ